MPALYVHEYSRVNEWDKAKRSATRLNDTVADIAGDAESAKAARGAHYAWIRLQSGMASVHNSFFVRRSAEANNSWALEHTAKAGLFACCSECMMSTDDGHNLAKDCSLW